MVAGEADHLTGYWLVSLAPNGRAASASVAGSLATCIVVEVNAVAFVLAALAVM